MAGIKVIYIYNLVFYKIQMIHFKHTISISDMTFSHLGQQNKKLSKVKLGQVGVCSNIVQNHLHGLKEVICAHYWPQFT